MSELPSLIIARSQLSDGNLSRLRNVMIKARRGEPITIGVIGGSITYGEKATVPVHSYANLVAEWWIANFPKSRITLVNAGISATGSKYGCLRVQRDLLSQHPDFVVVEFGVNDKDDLENAHTYEGLVRQIVADPRQPAVVLLFMMHHIGTNAQDTEGEVGRRYQLPMISYRDALWPEIQAGRTRLEDYFADTVHPNDRGHAAAAVFINSLLQDTVDHLPKVVKKDSPAGLPPARFTDFFTHTTLIDGPELKPVASTGWTYDPATRSLCSSLPGSTAEFEITGRQIDLIFKRQNGPNGIASVTVDDGPAVQCNAFMEPTWGGFPQLDTVAKDLPPGKHHVKIELLEKKDPLSTGNDFCILGLGAAGVLQ